MQGVSNPYNNSTITVTLTSNFCTKKVRRQSELCSWLQNVLATISDRKIPHFTNGNTIEYYTAEIVSAQDYYAGVGMVMPGRSFSSSLYKYGAQGSEVDEEINGTRNTITTFYREGNLETMQWWTPDNVLNPSESPYVMMVDNPIWFNDTKGDTVKTEGTEAFKNKANASLEALKKTKSGLVYYNELQNSKNIFTIKETEGGSNFVPSDPLKAYSEEHKEQKDNISNGGLIPDEMLKGGSGGTINWNPNEGAEKTFESTGKQTSHPDVNLSHELFGHGIDANRGTMNDVEFRGLVINEWQATHRENQLRSELGLPLRKYYGTEILKNPSSGEIIYEQGLNKLIKGTRSIFIPKYDYKVNNPPTKQ